MLSDDQVAEIRAIRAATNATYQNIGRRFGCSPTHARRICSGQQRTQPSRRYQRAPIMEAAHLGLDFYAAQRFVADTTSRARR